MTFDESHQHDHGNTPQGHLFTAQFRTRQWWRWITLVVLPLRFSLCRTYRIAFSNPGRLADGWNQEWHSPPSSRGSCHELDCKNTIMEDWMPSIEWWSWRGDKALPREGYHTVIHPRRDEPPKQAARNKGGPLRCRAVRTCHCKLLLRRTASIEDCQ